MTGTPDALSYDDAALRRVLRDTRTIAMVGASPNWVRPSNFAMKYLQGKGMPQLETSHYLQLKDPQMRLF